MLLRLITVSFIICSQFIYSFCFPALVCLHKKMSFHGMLLLDLFMTGNGYKRAVVSFQSEILACHRALSTVIFKTCKKILVIVL